MSLYGLETVLRTEIVASARTWYLAREDFDVRTRIALSLNERRDSVEEQIKLLPADSVVQTAKETRRKHIADQASQLGLQEQTDKHGKLLGYGDNKLGLWPKETDLVRDFLQSLHITEGQHIYRILSGYTHLRAYSIMQNQVAVGTPDENGDAWVEPKLKLSTVVNLTRLATLSYVHSSSALIQAYGGPTDGLDQIIERIDSTTDVNS